MKTIKILIVIFLLSCSSPARPPSFTPPENFNQVTFLADGFWKVIIDENSLSDDVFFEFTIDSHFIINNYERFAKKLQFTTFDVKNNQIQYSIIGDDIENILKIVHKDTLLLWQKKMPNKKAKIFRIPMELE